MPKSWTKKTIITLLTAAILISPMMWAISAVPARAQLVTTDPVNLGEKISEFFYGIGTNLKKTMGAIAYKNALSALLGKLAYDAATYIATAGTGEETLVYTDKWYTYLGNVGDAALGEYISSLANEAGFSNFNICDPGDLTINLALGLETNLLEPDQPACTLTELGENWYETVQVEDFSEVFTLSFDPAENHIGQFLTLQTSFGELAVKEEEGAKYDRLSDGPVSSQTGAISQYVQTPGDWINDQFKWTVHDANQPYMTYTGEALADSINIFTNTLYTKLIQRLQQGFIDTTTGTSLSGLVAGESGGTSKGVEAARATYATFNQPTFNPGGEIDTSYQLVEEDLIDSTLQLAIEQEWSVQEYINYLNENTDLGADQFLFGVSSTDLSSPSGGLSRRAIYYLKKYRIVPVGWQVAADFIYLNRNNDDYTGITLGDLADCGTDDAPKDCYFNKCDDATDANSVFCKLVNPDTILKAPATTCSKESYTYHAVYNDFYDQDGNEYNQLENILTRDKGCVEEQTCISEDSEGNCYYYGDCVKEKDIFYFEGEECDEQYQSCQSFTRLSDDENVSYLTDTVNYGDCNDPNAEGCQWYCLADGEAEDEWGCASATESYKECNDDNGRADETYCYCDLSLTCEVSMTESSCSGTDAAGTDYDCYLDQACSADSDTYVQGSGGSSSYCECTVTDYAEVADGSTSGTTVNNSLYCELQDDSGTTETCSSSLDSYVVESVCDSTTCTDNCEITEGSYSCMNESGDTCYIGQEDINPEDGKVAMLNSQVESCNEEDDGCTEFIEAEGNNLVFNSSFEYSNYNSTSGVYELGICSEDENYCSTDADCSGECVGWQRGPSLSGTEIQDSEEGYTATSYGQQYLYLDGAGGNLIQEVDYQGYDLENRSFALNLTVFPESCTTLNIDLTAETSADVVGYSESWAVDVSSGAGGWDTYTTEPLTFQANTDGVTYDQLNLKISNDCSAYLDAVQLEETDSAGNYADYAAEGLVYLNGQRDECAVDEVGCDYYQPTSGKVRDKVPGIVTNYLSDACGNGSDYSDPDCSQCEEEYIGCDFYQEQPVDSIIPLGSDTPSAVLTLLSAAPGTQLRDGVNYRTGKYCSQDQTKKCFDNTDCSGSGYCLDTVSLIPSTAESCSASDVGCEAYTNLGQVEEGGETVEYYSDLRQCVKTADTETATFYTWEGSDESGYQLRAYDLKEASNGSPCTHLDLTSDDFNASCTDGSVTTATDCTSAYGTDADCLLYYDDAGNPWYRYSSDVIYVDDNCTPLRNDLDNRTYYALPSLSTTCSDDVVGCREYKGSAGGDVQLLVEDNFEDCTTGSWESSSATLEAPSESVYVDDCSLGLAADAYQELWQTDDDGTVLPYLDEGVSYIVTFWAKGDGALDVSIEDNGVSNYFSEDGSSSSSSSLTLDSEDWQEYTLGPLYYEEAGLFEGVADGNENLKLEFSGTTGYIDMITLQESESQYLIKDSADLCQNYEGCQEYKDGDNEYHYLKSFDSLCSEDAVGCAAVINTQNTSYDGNFESKYPFTIRYNEGNEYDEDDVIIADDQVEYYVLGDEETECSSDAKGCQAMGLPEVNEQDDTVKSWETVYYLNDPDEYDSILCQYQQLGCDRYESEYDGVTYFKDPGDKTCYYDTTDAKWYKSKQNSDDAEEDCPLFNEGDTPSYPMGSVCDDQSGTLEGEYCQSDDDCNGGRCVSTEDETGWVGICSEDESGCTKYSAPTSGDELLYNNSFEYDEEYNSGSEVYTEEEIAEGSQDQKPDDWQDINDIASTATNTGEEILDYINTYSEYGLGSVPVCDSFEQNDTQVWNYSNSLYAAASSSEPCIILSQDKFTIDENETYNYSAYVQTASDDTEFSLGLLYFAYDETEENYLLHSLEGLEAYTYTDITAVTASETPLTAVRFLDASDQGSGSISQSYAVTAAGAYNDNDSGNPSSNQGLVISVAGGTNWGDTNVEFTVETDNSVQESVTFEIPGSYIDGSAGYYVFYVDTEGNLYWADTEEDGESAPYFNPTASYLNFSEAVLNSGALHSTLFAGAQDATATSGDWNYYHGTIGYGKNIQFPEGTDKVMPFLYVAAGGGVYVDDISLKEEQNYYYLDYTVDGTEEGAVSGSTTDECVSGVDNQYGCVAFRDDSKTSLSTLTDEQWTNDYGACSSCDYSQTTDECSGVANSCDTNAVIKVRLSRVCDQWIGCSLLYRDPSDIEGVEDEVICQDMQLCDKINQQTGGCDRWVEQNVSPGAGDELIYESDPTDTESIDRLEDLSLYSGLARAGMQWPYVYLCDGGDNDGEYCNPDEDNCADDSGYGTCTGQLEVKGYYLPTEMEEAGDVDSEVEIIEDGDFEDLTCAAYGTTARSKYDTDSKCILDRHCQTTNISSYNDSVITSHNSVVSSSGSGVSWAGVADCGEDCIQEYDSSESYTSSAAGYYYCPNHEDYSTSRFWTFTNWEPYDSSNDSIEVVQYSDDEAYGETGETRFDSDYNDQTSGAGSSDFNSDWNNVLRVDPSELLTGGVTVTGLDEDIVKDNEYVLSFWAKYQGDAGDDDGINVALRHTDTDGTVTYDNFAAADGMADIVFVVDSSSTMSGEITNVINGLTDLVDGIGDIDAKYAVVDLENYPILTQDFTSDTGTVSSALSDLQAKTAFVCTYDAIYKTINNSLDYSVADGVGTFIDHDGGSLLVENGEGDLTYRSDAEKFVILVTDVDDPNEGTCTYETEAEALSAVSNIGDGFNVHVVTYIGSSSSTDYREFYDSILEEINGTTSGYFHDIGATSYSSLMSSIAENVRANTEGFSFDGYWQQYTLGPIVAENKTDDPYTTDLIITQSSVSGGVPFLIDDVSLKSGLSVSSSEIQGRTCRAWPEDSSIQCQYTEDGGNYYEGWMGYCLEYDPEDRYNCLQWWPAETLKGEKSFSNVKEDSGYSERSSANHCLLAKGYSNFGVCVPVDDDGIHVTLSLNDGDFDNHWLCTEDVDCDSGEICFRGDRENSMTNSCDPTNCVASIDWDRTCTYETFSDGDILLKDSGDDTYDYSDNIDDGGSQNPYEIMVRSFQAPNVSDKYNFSAGGFCYDSLSWGSGADINLNTGDGGERHIAITKLPANPAERNINISEIEEITLDTGCPGWHSYGYDETPAWSPYSDQSNCTNSPVTFNFLDGSADWDYSIDGEYQSSYCHISADSGTYGPQGLACWWLREYDDYSDLDSDNNPTADYVYTFAFSAWNDGNDIGDCDINDLLADTEDFDDNCSVDKSDTLSAQVHEITGGHYYNPAGMSSSLTDANLAAYQNPWSHLDTFGSLSSWVSSSWDAIGYSDNIESNFGLGCSKDESETDGLNYCGNYFVLGANSDTSSWWRPGTSSGEGGNVVSVYFDFDETGYLDNIYALTWYGATNTGEDSAWGTKASIDPNAEAPMELTYKLKEPCLVAAESVDENNQTMSWVNRVSNQSYVLPGTGSVYEMYSAIDGGDNPYGSISATDTDADIFEEETQQFVQEAGSTANAGWPMACLSECSKRVCANDYSTACETSSDCIDSDGEENACIGIGGVNVTDGSLNYFCQAGDTDCIYDQSQVAEYAGEFDGVDGITLDDQIFDAGGEAMKRYKHLFAQPQQVYQYMYDSTNGWIWDSISYSDWDYGYDFDNMPVCDGNTRDYYTDYSTWTGYGDDEDEYCGVRPTLSNLAINGSATSGTLEVSKSEKIILSFDSSVDAEQTPLEYVNIDWDDGTDPEEDYWQAAPGTHYYEKYYWCTEESSNYCDADNADCSDEQRGKGVCVFTPKIQLIDHWGFCSGTGTDYRYSYDGDDCDSWNESLVTVEMKAE